MKTEAKQKCNELRACQHDNVESAKVPDRVGKYVMLTEFYFCTDCGEKVQPLGWKVANG